MKIYKIYIQSIIVIFIILLVNLIKCDNESIETKEENICKGTKPSKDIIKDCIDGNKISSKTCCYMEVKYQYNNYYACIPMDKENADFEKEIKRLKEEYNAKSISIKCKSSFIQFKFIFLLLFYLILNHEK